MSDFFLLLLFLLQMYISFDNENPINTINIVVQERERERDRKKKQ